MSKNRKDGKILNEVTFKLPNIKLDPLQKTRQRKGRLTNQDVSGTDSKKTRRSSMDFLSLPTARPPSTTLPPISPRYLREGSWESGSEDGGYDTDLETIEPIVFVHAPPRYDMTCRELYLDICAQHGICPCSRFLREHDSDCVNLAHYGLGNNGVMAVAKALERNLKVTILNLYDNGIEYKGAECLGRMLSMNCFITHLNLSENRIGTQGIVAIGRMLMENASLTFMNLANCGISGRDMKEFCRALGSSPPLKTLLFHSNDLSDHGSSLMADALSTNATLETLDLSWNNIRIFAAKEIARGLKGNRTIRDLDLSWNTFQDRGAMALQAYLASNTSLQVLDITNCGIHIKGAGAIASGLGANRRLEVLKIGRNPFQSAGVPLLLEAVRLNERSRMRELILDGIVFLDDAEYELARLLQQRPSFSCSWASSIRGGHVWPKGFSKPHELDVFLNFVRNMGFRLVDLFMILAKDNQVMKVTKDEFVIGLKKLNAPLKDDQIRLIFDTLDMDKNGTLDFQEFFVMRSHTLKKYVRKIIEKAHAIQEQERMKKIIPEI